MSTETIERFVIGDSKSYQGKGYRYHVGYVTLHKLRTLFHSAIVDIQLDILHEEDLDYLKAELLKLQKEKVEQLIILGYHLLQT